MAEKFAFDKNGIPLQVGDKVHNDWGYDLVVYRGEDGNLYGRLVCDDDHPCKDIPYALNESEITKL